MFAGIAMLDCIVHQQQLILTHFLKRNCQKRLILEWAESMFREIELHRLGANLLQHRTDAIIYTVLAAVEENTQCALNVMLVKERVQKLVIEHLKIFLGATRTFFRGGHG